MPLHIRAHLEIWFEPPLITHLPSEEAIHEPASESVQVGLVEVGQQVIPLREGNENTTLLNVDKTLLKLLSEIQCVNGTDLLGQGAMSSN